jgi:GNAT superfamily N-acetyltransferase
MTRAFVVRPATVADVEIVAHHRVGMFRDMGRTTPDVIEPLRAASIAALREMMPRGEYVGWLASPAGEPARIVAGAGVQLRRVLPFPTRPHVAVAHGSEAIVLNVYTEPEYRRRGAARVVMAAVLTWARGAGIDRLVLHAAPDGRHLYESLGFVGTNEMRWEGEAGA